MLVAFNNEVLTRGPAAVLPQNLNSQWLSRIQKMAEDFLDSNFSLEECKTPQDLADPILTACVHEILYHQHGTGIDFPLEKIMEKVSIYAIAVIMEAANRESNFGLEPPSLDNILSLDRIMGFKKSHPDFIQLLQEACVVKTESSSWIDKFKKKFLARILAVS